jgi:hypothetical protein
MNSAILILLGAAQNLQKDGEDMEDSAATERALETETGDGGGGIVSDETSTTVGGLFPDTPAPEKPVPQPQAHRGRITGVTAETFDSGARALKFSWQSLENAQDDNLTVFPPKEYCDNPQVDPATLRDDDGVTKTSPDGSRTYTTDSTRVQYAKRVRNKKGDGTIESIIALAIEQGHSVASSHVPRTFEQVAAYLNELTTGTEVIGLMQAQGGDGEYADRLRTTRFGNPINTSNPKFFRKYRKLWES